MFNRFVLSLSTCVVLTSCGGGSQTNTADIRVTCQGDCAESGISSYVNSAAQVWTYRNTSDKPLKVDVNFSNLAAGQELTYVFGNGFSPSSINLPNPGQAAPDDGSAGKTSPGTSPVPELVVQGDLHAIQERQDRWRQSGGHSEALVFQVLKRESSPNFSASTSTSASASSSTYSAAASAATRTWIDATSDEPKAYDTKLLDSCLDGDGRRVKIWADDASVSAKTVNKKAREAFKSTMCDSNGAVARLGRLIGKVWSPIATRGFIRESTGLLQDIHVAIVSAGEDTGWAGYFYGANSLLKSEFPDSNEALVLFINADQMKISLSYTQSLLIHELTHMIYFHERHMLNPQAPRQDTWLSEMVAMMSEDIVAPVLVRDQDGLPYQTMLSYRVPAYINTGGGVNMVAWADIEKANPYYSMAGSFGAYLNRQYGLAIFKDLVKGCLDLRNSWDCLDTVIKKNGGKSADDEFNQFGLTMFGLGDSSGPSRKYSFPRMQEDGYILEGLELSSLKKYRPSKSADLKFWAIGMHSYFVESARVNIFTFTRRGITIPPRSQLNIMVRQGAAG